ncbi:MAG: hypothetical protein C5B53_02470 [Candidatus Melainabacteria bacterium]|nr:MAG: hypothetical protein C5B53_02470 [Candidatus Melainabacteria bacterium]
MKSKLLLSIFVACQGIAIVLPVWASTIKYTAPTADQAGKFEGELPIKTIGPLKLPNGAAVFQDDQIKIMAVPDWLFDRNVVLSGPIVRAEFAAQGTSQLIAGLAYFTEGEWLSNLASPRALDVVETLSGETIRGRILSRIDNAFVIKPEGGATQKIGFSAIKTINSPRAYRFTIPTSDAKVLPADNSISADATKVSFSPAFLRGGVFHGNPTVPKSTLAGAEPGISKTSIAAFVAMDIVNEIAPAIVLPLVLQHSTQAAALRTISQFNTYQQRASGVPIPLSSNSQGDARNLGPFGPAINPLKAR